ncbi:MAG: trigger factor, partial [Elusimicrobia bacterium]|nr:trigger factor [Elusimicrobiota bacterium]
APLDMVKKQFAGHIKERALDNMIRESTAQTIREQKLNPVTPPLIKKIDFNEGKPLSFEIEVETAPVFEPKNYVQAKIVKKTPKADEREVDETIKEMLEHNARLEADSPEAVVGPESFAVVDYTAFKDGKEMSEYKCTAELVDMASPQTIAGLCPAIMGAKKGETREFNADVSGAKLLFKAAIGEIKKKTLPLFDDTFAKETGYESAEKLKEKIKDSLLKNAQKKSEEDVVRQIEDHILKENPISLPPSIVEYHVGLSTERILERVSPHDRHLVTEEEQKKLREKIRPAVERDIRISYIMHGIAEKEKIEVSPADYDGELEKSLARSANENERQAVRKFFESRRDDIMVSIRERKIIEFLKSKAVIQEA